MKTIIMLLVSYLIMVPNLLCADCTEYKMVDHGDRIEVVCIGDPPTDAEKQISDKNLERESALQRKQDKINEIQHSIDLNCSNVKGMGNAKACKDSKWKSSVQQAINSPAPENPSDRTRYKDTFPTKDSGICFGNCANEQGICINQCRGNSQCVGNCAAAQGRCTANCTQ